MSLDYGALPRERSHRYLPEGLEISHWKDVEKYFAELQEREIGSAAALVSWLDDYSELFVAMSEASSIRYIRMTEQTDRPQYRDSYIAYLENVEPQSKMAQFNLNRKFADCSFRQSLPKDSYDLIDKKIENSVLIFRASNVELEKEERKVAQQQQGLTASMTVAFRGRERTMAEMSKFLEMTDRATREESWRLTQKRMESERDRLDGIFDEMVRLRDKIARNADFADFRDYSFAVRERFDYGPSDCFKFHDAVEKQIVPIVRETYRRRQNEMGLSSLRPWDTVVDPRGRPPLRPFAGTTELIAGCQQVFQKIHSTFSDEFSSMIRLNLLDLESRPGKAPGGYNTELLDLRLPFIFMNSVGRDQDVWTLLHESGHAFHVFEMREKNLHYLYRSDNTPAEIAEVASMSMELIGGEHIAGIFYNDEDAARSRHDHFLSIASLLPWICTIDAFQHWVYTNPGHSREERRDAWEKTYDRFGPGVSWDSLYEEKRSLWHRQIHLFQSPFYYIEYGIAQLGALGIWSRYKRNQSDTVEALREAMALGGSRRLPELFNAAGLPWDFSAEVVASYGSELRKILVE